MASAYKKIFYKKKNSSHSSQRVHIEKQEIEGIKESINRKIVNDIKLQKRAAEIIHKMINSN